MSYTSISNLDSDLNLWEKGLEFYRDELSLLGNRLIEVSSRNTKQEAFEGIEHFQNQFMIQRKNIQDIKHEVKSYKNSISSDVYHHDGQVNTELIEEGKILKDKYESFERIMNGLRHEFNAFLSKWM
ncbi:MAG: hypothetical protein WBC06_17890 [Chitinophagaceae bacterium]